MKLLRDVLLAAGLTVAVVGCEGKGDTRGPADEAHQSRAASWPLAAPPGKQLGAAVIADDQGVGQTVTGPEFAPSVSSGGMRSNGITVDGLTAVDLVAVVGTHAGKGMTTGAPSAPPPATGTATTPPPPTATETTPRPASPPPPGELR
jgi:hypothetical protein